MADLIVEAPCKSFEPDLVETLTTPDTGRPNFAVHPEVTAWNSWIALRGTVMMVPARPSLDSSEEGLVLVGAVDGDARVDAA